MEPTERHKVRWDLQHGEHWDKIEENLLFGQCIGEGSFARVYDGYDKLLKQTVAVKVIKKNQFQTDKKKELVQLEIDILSKMNHRNVVKFERLLEDHKRVMCLSNRLDFYRDWTLRESDPEPPQQEQ